MPTILETIREYEQDILSMIAESWGINQQVDAHKNIAKQIAVLMGDPATAKEIYESMPPDVKTALHAISLKKGRVTWEQFVRKFGDIREMGAIRREKERPDRQPVSVSEHLFYRGLIGRAFFDSEGGLKEYAFIPDELSHAFKVTGESEKEKMHIPLAKKQRLLTTEADDRIIDHAATLLAELRKSIRPNEVTLNNPDIPSRFLIELLMEGGTINTGGNLHADQIKDFLEMDRPSTLFFLAEVWMKAESLNEINFIPQLDIEGGWKNNAVETRMVVLDVLKKLPAGKWIAINDFVSWFQDNHPDFMRTRGEFESWLVKSVETGGYLRGFENWDAVEGSYLRFIIANPSYWLALTDLGNQSRSSSPTHFRKSVKAELILNGEAPDYHWIQRNTFLVDNTGKLIIDRMFPRDIRYQIARFCDLEVSTTNQFIYRITPGSLSRISNQGLKISQLLSTIKKYGKKPIPKNIAAALQRWETHQTEAVVEAAVILRVQNQKAIEQLLKSQAGEYIIERFNPTTVSIKKGAAPFIQAALLNMGIFSDIEPEV